MPLQGVLTELLLPPLLLVLVALAAGIAARRRAGLVVVLASLGLYALATPFVAGWLRHSLEASVPEGLPGPAPAAIIILAAEAVRSRDGPEVGPMTLERLRAGAALHRRTGLPILVTGGPFGRGQPPIAQLMAASLAEDFSAPARWLEERAADTAGNAAGSAMLLGNAGVESAYLVTHGWHMARSVEAFSRAGLPVTPAPVRRQAPPEGIWRDFFPRADHLGSSWYMLREWAGRAVYWVRAALGGRTR